MPSSHRNLEARDWRSSFGWKNKHLINNNKTFYSLYKRRINRGEGDTRYIFNIGDRKWLQCRRERRRMLPSCAILAQADCGCDPVHYFPFILLSKNIHASFLNWFSFFLLAYRVTSLDHRSYFTHGKVGCDWIHLLKSYQLTSVV